MPHPSATKFIQEVVGSKSFKSGSFTKAAKRHHEGTIEFAKDVVAHPEHYQDVTRKRAQFLLNIQKKKGSSKK
jgi:hypothetical protein